MERKRFFCKGIRTHHQQQTAQAPLEAAFSHILRSCRLADKATGSHAATWADVRGLMDQELALCVGDNFEFSTLCAFAVGTALTGGPPHRSQRALLTHWAPTSGHDAQSLFGVRVQNTNRWKPAVGQTVHALPGHPVSLAPLP